LTDDRVGGENVLDALVVHIEEVARMAWRMAGTYVATCSCQLVCPCPTDNPPTGPGGECRGVAVFGIREGNLDDTDLSGTTFAFCNLFPSNLTAGNWSVGIVVDEGASDDQAQALERILHGEEGGPFGEFAGFFGDWKGVERGPVSVSDGDRPSGRAGDTEFTFEPLEGPDGTHTTVKNAMFGFAPEFRVGKAPTKSSLFGIDFEGVYGETADYEFSTEMPEGAPAGRV
jgi:hypothetical protein